MNIQHLNPVGEIYDFERSLDYELRQENVHPVPALQITAYADLGINAYNTRLIINNGLTSLFLEHNGHTTPRKLLAERRLAGHTIVSIAQIFSALNGESVATLISPQWRVIRSHLVEKSRTLTFSYSFCYYEEDSESERDWHCLGSIVFHGLLGSLIGGRYESVIDGIVIKPFSDLSRINIRLARQSMIRACVANAPINRFGKAVTAILKAQDKYSLNQS